MVLMLSAYKPAWWGQGKHHVGGVIFNWDNDREQFRMRFTQSPVPTHPARRIHGFISGL